MCLVFVGMVALRQEEFGDYLKETEILVLQQPGGSMERWNDSCIHPIPSAFCVPGYDFY